MNRPGCYVRSTRQPREQNLADLTIKAPHDRRQSQSYLQDKPRKSICFSIYYPVT